MPTPATDAADIQGLVRSGYGQLTAARFLLLRIADTVAARAWLEAAPVTSMAHLDTPQEGTLNIALTCEGLRALRLPEQALGGFSAEFLSGMAGDESRSRRLGDIGANAPDRWRWGTATHMPHLLLLLYATPERLQDWMRTVMAPPWDSAFTVLELLQTATLDQHEPFGFLDGVSQPTIDWTGKPDPAESAHETYSNLVATGEMLLGYPNEYGKYTDRPLLDPALDPAALLPPAEDHPERHDLGRNGCYLVFRQLQQDVGGFWRFLDNEVGGNAEARTRLAEAIVGRQISGAPLLPQTGGPIPGVGPDTDDIRQNSFTFDADADGLVCPLGAHIRRANPRNADLPPGTRGTLSRLLRDLGLVHQALRDDLISSTRFHRMLRRGRDYGVQMSPEAALRAPAAAEAGLHFICLNANISRQFEFVQGAWLAGIAFDGLTGERDPLTAPREGLPGGPPAGVFTMAQTSGLNRRIAGLPQFVTVRGGAYFFLPGLRALRWIAGVHG
ncbi:Dyp-type peroxidase [Limobrevibacterium gyesilva]|uniref:Peroxidase n=1 Tax=Limobrevibacterium gyesilva TaxID=2991712 RepID=A0AA41YK64_9PROT|nr:hypothetical protein [Limobrevibacterium gyesilva]MCW3475289.1 hypothetical protein [Limobrevibacterium gyesilva]